MVNLPAMTLTLPPEIIGRPPPESPDDDEPDDDDDGEEVDAA